MSDTRSKSSVDQIRQRFDSLVENFSDANAGQRTAIDGGLALNLIAEGAAKLSPSAGSLLDVGCGAGNWSIKLLGKFPGMTVTLVDLSKPMLDRAQQRVTQAGGVVAGTLQSDIRTCEFEDGSFDLIVAGAVLHHLRADEEWAQVLKSFHRWLKPGGSVWVYDMVKHEIDAVESILAERYFNHLTSVGGEEYARKVFAYIEEEDSPRPITWQIDQLRAAGFAKADILHKTATFGAYVGVK